MVKVYNKLVRDRIPEIIKKDGKICKARILSKDEYIDALNQKLDEEIKEYQEGHDINELVDVQEIIYAIVVSKGMTLKEFDSLRSEKKKTNGGFEKMIFLENVESNYELV
jgi:predicted house-cleaning noncanonical NTP pyrophosphatase (MazG superfamily)